VDLYPNQVTASCCVRSKADEWHPCTVLCLRGRRVWDTYHRLLGTDCSQGLRAEILRAMEVSRRNSCLGL
jgi:hypothetical protein